MSAQSNTSSAIVFDAAIQAALTAPFDPNSVEFKAGATTQAKDRALALAFVDARTYQARLDEAAPGWTNAYEHIIAGDRVIVVCKLTVAGVTRQATGESLMTAKKYDGSLAVEENSATSAEAQAFKRACAAFGLGRYLYNVPQVWAEYDAGKRQFTPVAVNALREMLRTGQYTAPAPSLAPANGHASAAGANGHAPAHGVPATGAPATGDAPNCPKCGGAMWDNRVGKKNPAAPDFKCRDKACDGVIWPPRQPKAAANGSAVPF